MAVQTEPDAHVGDIGFAITLHVRERTPAGVIRDKDLSAMTTLDILLCQADGTIIEFLGVPFATATQGGNGAGTDGRIMALSIAATFPLRGDYTSQARLAKVGWSGMSSKKTFSVGSRLVATPP